MKKTFEIIFEIWTYVCLIGVSTLLLLIGLLGGKIEIDIYFDTIKNIFKKL